MGLCGHVYQMPIPIPIPGIPGAPPAPGGQAGAAVCREAVGPRGVPDAAASFSVQRRQLRDVHGGAELLGHLATLAGGADDFSMDWFRGPFFGETTGIFLKMRGVLWVSCDFSLKPIHWHLVLSSVYRCCWGTIFTVVTTISNNNVE